MEAGTGLMCLQAKEHQRGKEGLSLRLRGEHGPADTFIWTSDPRTVGGKCLMF